jgi:hypothetical protein
MIEDEDIQTESLQYSSRKRKRQSRKYEYSRTRKQMNHESQVDHPLVLLSLCMGLSFPSFTEVDDILCVDFLLAHFSSWNRFLRLSCPRVIEKFFLHLCGKLCAKIYKLVKGRWQQRYQALNDAISLHTADDSLECPLGLCHVDAVHDSSTAHSWDEQRLIYLRRILHHIFVRIVEIPGGSVGFSH